MALTVLVLSALLLCGDGQPWEGGGVNATSRCASWASWFRIKQVSVIVQHLSSHVNTSLLETAAKKYQRWALAQILMFTQKTRVSKRKIFHIFQISFSINEKDQKCFTEC